MHVFTIGKSNALTTRQLLLSLIKTGKESSFLTALFILFWLSIFYTKDLRAQHAHNLAKVNIIPDMYNILSVKFNTIGNIGKDCGNMV